MNNKMAVEVRGLRKSYGKFEVLKGIDLQVAPGTIFGLLGSNGAGKTTLIKLLTGSLRPTSGQVSVLGLDPLKAARQLRPQIGAMPQAPALYEDLSARANIEFFGAAHRLPNLKQRADEILAFTSLSERQRDPVYTFSGGMKQRVSLACTLIHQPQVLFLDEPTAGVDPKLRETFWQHFRELAGQGVTLFISTHLMDEALLCDQLAIMRDGQMLVCDTPKNIMRQGQTRVRVVRDSYEDVHTVTDYAAQLPGVLQKYRLDPSVTKIELEQDTLETIMLRLIDQQVEALPTTAEKEVSRV